MKANSKSTNIIEVFSSIQGEGPYVGCRQIFIRFAKCNLNCEYCDTKFQPEEFCKMETKAGSGILENLKNPILSETLICKIEEFLSINHHSISLTGGEPLLNVEFISNFLSEFNKSKNKNKLKIYLETNGTLPNELIKLISFIDIVSMDVKLQSSTNTSTSWEKHKAFIEIAKEFNKEIFVKVVLTKKITTEELENIISLVKNQHIPLILQPVDSSDINIIPDSAFLMDVQEILLKELSDVRLIPQVHKYLKLL